MTTIWVDDDGREARATLDGDGSYHVAPEAFAHLMRRAGLRKVGDITDAHPAPTPRQGSSCHRHLGAARRRHECAKPRATGREGSTWDCPECGRVWRVGLPFGPAANAYPTWYRAGWWASRQHRRRVAAGEGTP